MTARPRLGFLGLGWIGRHRMEAIVASGLAEIVALADPSAQAVEAAHGPAPGAARGTTLEDVLAAEPDGVVIATPSALHAEQTICVLRAGAAVFCQKPLGRDAQETAAAVEAARSANRLLAVDFSYRHTAAMQAIRASVEAGELGRVFALDLTFHNAYGPDKAWFYDRSLSGGGCLMDLGTHLVDLALWLTDFPSVENVTAHLFAGGRPVGADAVEDYAVATLTLGTGAVVRLACSWRVQAGADAVIAADVFGTEGGASLRNPGGGFYDLSAHRHRGTATEPLAMPPDPWGGRAAVAWCRRLAVSPRFDPAAEELVRNAKIVDSIYQAAGQGLARN